MSLSAAGSDPLSSFLLNPLQPVTHNERGSFFEQSRNLQVTINDFVFFNLE